MPDQPSGNGLGGRASLRLLPETAWEGPRNENLFEALSKCATAVNISRNKAAHKVFFLKR
jgi:hypothetical protein